MPAVRKTDKKIDNQIRLLLTNLCENQLKAISGFEWLTHSANYQKFPQSLNITFVFNSQPALAEFRNSAAFNELAHTLTANFSGLGIKLKHEQLRFVVEAA